jgi:hypothetical protein
MRPTVVGARVQIRQNRSGRSSVTSRQRQRIQRSQQAAHRSEAAPRTEESNHPSSESRPPHHSLIETEIRRPDYWRDLSIEIVGTILSALLIYGFGRVLGYIERPSVRSELLSVLGLLATLFPLLFAWGRVRASRARHPGGSRAARFAVYLRAIEPHWTVPTFIVGVALCVNYL